MSRHAAGIGVAPRAVDGDHQAIGFELPAQPDKSLEHIRARRGIRAGVVPQAGNQLDPVARHRAVMAIQPSPQPGLLRPAVPDNRDIPVHQKPRILVDHDLNPTSRRPPGHDAANRLIHG